ncbi:MAG: carboxy terminal-processing peptidase [Bacteriovoracaceae bacterium]|nr:carboxy terminal-processing peptidase [Bacteriovoracaceae bacterium]
MNLFRPWILWILLLSVVHTSAYSREDEKKSTSANEEFTSEYSREMMLGGLLKGALETMHLSKMKLDDDLSQKSFLEFIKKLDFGKQFLLLSDVKQLEKYRKEMDDSLMAGKLTIVTEAFDLLDKRYKMIKTYAMDRLKKPFDFKQVASVETDPDKREFLKTEEELKSYWEKMLQLEVMGRYADAKEEQDFPEDVKKGRRSKTEKEKEQEKAKKEKEKKNKKVVKLTQEQLIAKATDEVTKNYQKIFSRLETQNKKRDYQLDKFYNSITEVFDPHTYYMVPEEKDDFDIDMSGKLEGIGALLREDGPYIKVEEIIPGSVAWKSKQLDKDDVILKVGQANDEPVDIVNMRIQDAVKLIRGKKGTVVKLTVKKPDGMMTIVELKRDVVSLEESYVKSTILEKKDSPYKIGYVTLPKFYRDFANRNGRNCTDDMRKALVDLNKAGVNALILDLRNNGGGALIDANMMSGLFIGKGPIVQVKASTGSVEVLKNDDPEISFDKPMITMVNANSASASEIVAAALQDYGRSLVVGGDHTHGKGTVQQVVDFDSVIPPIAKVYSPFGALKITIQKFYRITGGSTQYKGVTPDIILPDPMSVLEKGERFLDYSLPWGQVAPVEFSSWKKFTYDRKDLTQKSQERMKKSEKFKHILSSVEWYKERKDATLRSLNLEKFWSERELIRLKSKEFDDLKPDQNIKVTSALKLTKTEDKERFERLTESLQKDAYIEESMNILVDNLSAKK